MIFRCTGGLQFKRETHPFLQNTYHWASNRRTQGFHSCLLYLIQNSLIHISLTYVSAPLFQVTYQSKLLTTAILPNILLWSRTYNTRQWLGIITLAIGVAIVVTLGEEGGSEPNESLIYSDKSTFLDWCLYRSLLFVQLVCWCLFWKGRKGTKWNFQGICMDAEYPVILVAFGERSVAFWKMILLQGRRKVSSLVSHYGYFGKRFS